MFTLKLQDIVGIVLLIIGIVIFMFTRSQLSTARGEVERLEVKEEVSEVTHEVKILENNQTITFQKEKEIKDEEVPGSIGTHTISPNDWL